MGAYVLFAFRRGRYGIVRGRLHGVGFVGGRCFRRRTLRLGYRLSRNLALRRSG